ncbi:MAG: hypothetical protein H6551_10215 [Chitinophagales bacterium]|nr:hypothetical protein [Chitinophagaceae bacterium]MCB9065501.1 hypothetical protein [Chitinophagales bacterium]
MKRLPKIVWIIIALLVIYFVADYTLYYILRYPHRLVHELGGDAIKNYYVFITHSMYGHGWWFDWMNYPYGEHIVYTDGMPALSLPLAWLRNYIHLTMSDVTFVLNMAIVVNFFLAIIFTYKSLRVLRVNRLLSLVFAILIIIMTPQFYRIFGHYGLGFLAIIPMMFYWMLRYYKSKKWKYPLFIFLLILFAMFVHPYYVAISLMWAGFYSLGYVLLERGYSFASRIKHVSPLMTGAIVAVVILKSVMAATDPVTDRPEYPYGTLSACTTGKDIFTSDKSFLWTTLAANKIIPGTAHEGAESYAYVGMVVLVVLIVLLIVGIIALIKKRDIPVVNKDDGYKLWFFIALASLLLGMGVPFVWCMDWLLDYVSAFRQFRSLGRFSLIYYYTVTVLACAIFYNWYVQRKLQDKKRLAYGVMLVAVIFWTVEAFPFANNVRKTAEKGPYLYDLYTSKEGATEWNKFLAEHNYKKDDFEAILVVPFIHVGSEKIWLADNLWGGFCLATKAGYQLKLPMVNASMSRSSWSRTFNQTKVVAGPYADKPLMDSIHSGKPLMLLVAGNTEMNPDLELLINTADSIGMNDSYTVYSLSSQKLLERISAAKQRAEEVAVTMTVADTSLLGGIPYYNHFDTGTAENAVSDKAAPAISGRDTVLDMVNAGSWDKGVLYECSVWALLNDVDYRSPDLELIQIDSIGEYIETKLVSFKQALDSKGMWARGAIYFTLRDNCANIRLSIVYNSPGAYHAMDELLIRKAADTVIHRGADGSLMVNNHILHANNAISK